MTDARTNPPPHTCELAANPGSPWIPCPACNANFAATGDRHREPPAPSETPKAVNAFAGVDQRSPEGHLRSVLWDILGGMGAESVESAAQRVVHERDVARVELSAKPWICDHEDCDQKPSDQCIAHTVENAQPLGHLSAERPVWGPFSTMKMDAGRVLAVLDRLSVDDEGEVTMSEATYGCVRDILRMLAKEPTEQEKSDGSVPNAGGAPAGAEVGSDAAGSAVRPADTGPHDAVGGHAPHPRSVRGGSGRGALDQRTSDVSPYSSRAHDPRGPYPGRPTANPRFRIPTSVAEDLDEFTTRAQGICEDVEMRALVEEIWRDAWEHGRLAANLAAQVREQMADARDAMLMVCEAAEAYVAAWDATDKVFANDVRYPELVRNVRRWQAERTPHPSPEEPK